MTDESLTLTIQREVTTKEIADFFENTYRSISPWVQRTHTDEDKRTFEIWYWENGDTDEPVTHRIFTLQEMLDALAKSRLEGGYLCCFDDMMAPGDLGMGCAQDNDTVLQFAVFGEITFG